VLGSAHLTRGGTVSPSYRENLLIVAENLFHRPSAEYLQHADAETSGFPFSDGDAVLPARQTHTPHVSVLTRRNKLQYAIMSFPGL